MGARATLTRPCGPTVAASSTTACAVVSRRTSPPDDIAVPGYLPGFLEPCDACWRVRSASFLVPLPAPLLKQHGFAYPPMGPLARSMPCDTIIRDRPESLSPDVPNSPLDRISDRIVLGSPTFRGFSPFVPLDPLGSSCPPCLFVRPHGRGASRISAWSIHRADLAATRLQCLERQRSHPSALFTRSSRRSSPGRSPPPRITVSDSACASSSSHRPFSRCLPVSLRVSTQLLSWASIASPSLSAPRCVRSSECQRSGRPT